MKSKYVFKMSAGDKSELENDSPTFLQFAADGQAFSKFLSTKKTKSPWFIAKFFDAFFRSYSQVMLCNNPISGLIMYLALFFAHPLGAGISTVTCVIGLATALLLHQPGSLISAGLTGYNPLLIGMVTACNRADLLIGSNFVPWFYVIGGCIVSVYLAIFLASLLGKAGMPGLTWSFNITQYLVLIVLWNYQPLNIGSQDSLSASSEINNTNDATMMMESRTEKIVQEEILQIDWMQILYGSISASGQVFAVNNITFSIFVYLGILLFSPIMALASFASALTGPLIYFTVNQPNLTNLTAAYQGVFGYNPLLTGAALCGYFYKLNTHTVITSLLGVILTAVLQIVFAPLYPAFLTVQTVPFCIVTCAFLISVSGNAYVFSRPEGVLTSPEKHLCFSGNFGDFSGAETESYAGTDDRSMDDDVIVRVVDDNSRDNSGNVQRNNAVV